MKKTGAFGHDFTARLLGNLSSKISQSVSDIQSHGSTQTIALDLPLFSAWLTQSAGNTENAIAAAREIRSQDHFITMRETLKAVRVSFEEQGIERGNKRITKLLGDVGKICGDLKRSYGVPSNQGIQGSFLIKALSSATSLFGISLPDRDFALSTPELMKSEATKSFTTVVKDITKELTSMERLGGARDAMTRSFKIEGQDWRGPKVQDPKFRNANSNWQKRM